MHPTLRRPLRSLGLCAAALALTASAHAQGGADAFYRAHYLHNEEGRLEDALELYRRAAQDDGLSRELRSKARAAAAEIREDLACADFTRLMPAETILYVELDRPGQRLGGLLEELGLLADGETPGLGISPRLLEAALDLRGAAVAITAIDPQGGPPEGVLLLHPGNQDALRGLIETAVGNGGQPVEPIGDSPTWSIEGEAFVTLTRRLVVASRQREAIAGVLSKMRGDRSASFAQAESLQRAADLRGDDLLFFHLNAEPVMPWIQQALAEEARRDPEVGMAMAFLDPESLAGVTGRLGVGRTGLALDVALELEEGHQNLAFNLLRTPALEERSLRSVPGGVAFFLASSLNRPGAVAPPSGDAERPIVTAMDFGREVFANIVDVTVFGLPPSKGSNGAPIPDVVASIHVNDGQRSRALWDFVLGLVSKSSDGAAAEPSHERVAGVDVERYSIHGVPVYLHTGDHELLLTASRSALERTLAAREGGSSVLDDPMYGESLEALGRDRNLVVLVSPARCAAMARAHAPAHDRAELDRAAQVLQDTVFCFGAGQTDTRLSLSARVANVPDVSPLLVQWMEERRGAVARYAPAPAAPVTANAPAGRDGVADLLAAGDLSAARELARVHAKQLGQDAVALNDLAWALLTEERFGGALDDVALTVSRRSNELDAHSSWALLDTLALAEFRGGDVERAVELQRKAVELARDSGREAEVLAPLERYEKALVKRRVRTAADA